MSLKLSDQSLLRADAYIDGAWLGGAARFPVTNPATGEVIAEVADLTADDTTAAIAVAKEAGRGWAALTAKERASIMWRWHHLIADNADDLAQILTAEMGKPLAEAKAEVAYGASFINWFAEEGRRITGDILRAHLPDKRLLVLKQPIGVYAAITPWNFPNAMVTRKLAPGMAAGCAGILKPAKQTPLSALALAELAHRAGIPKGVVNVLTTSDSASVGRVLTRHADVRKISFTGSTEVGRVLMTQAAAGIKKLSLELGGNAPMLVFADADMEVAVTEALASKFRNAGQTCVCANRIFVEDSIYDAFAKRLTEAVAKMKLGDGAKAGVTIGPLIDMAAVEKVEDHIADACQGGAKVVVGGKRAKLGGSFFEPTVLTGVVPAMKIFREETFGPVAPLFRFKTEAEAIALANDTIFGLAAYFFARDMARVWRVAEALEYGIVSLNTGVFANEIGPFGGVKQSGLGREGSRYGIDEYLEMKYVCLGGG